MAGEYERMMRLNLRRHWWRPWKMVSNCIAIAKWADTSIGGLQDCMAARARRDDAQPSMPEDGPPVSDAEVEAAMRGVNRLVQAFRAGERSSVRRMRESIEGVRDALRAGVPAMGPDVAVTVVCDALDEVLNDG
jgi:hypothetical protein